MTMSYDPSADDVQLAAYLAGDLDELAARRLEARLADDPALAARLDRIHDTVLALRAPDAIEPPPGMRERLAQRLADETASRTAAAPAAARRPWYRPLAVAAASVAAVAVVGAGAVGLGGLMSGEDSAEEAGIARMFSTDDSGPAREEAGTDADTDALQDDDAPEAPSILGEADDADTAEESAEHAPSDEDAGAREPRELILREDAAAAADERWGDMDAARSGCREQVETVVPDPAVPFGVEDDVIGDRRAFVYFLATAADDEAVLTRSARVAVDALTCDILEAEVDPAP